MDNPEKKAQSAGGINGISPAVYLLLSSNSSESDNTNAQLPEE